MRSIFVLRAAQEEPDGAEVTVLNILIASIFCVAFFISSTAAWLQRHRSALVVRLFYGFTVSSSGLATVLYLYRAHHHIAAFGGEGWLVAGHAAAYLLFLVGWVNSYLWRIAVVCSSTMDDRARLFTLIQMFVVIQGAHIMLWLALLLLLENPVVGSVVLISSLAVSAVKDSWFFFILASTLTDVQETLGASVVEAGTKTRPSDASSLDLVRNAPPKGKGCGTKHVVTGKQGIRAMDGSGGIQTAGEWDLPSPSGSFPVVLTGVTRSEGSLSAEKVVAMVRDSLVKCQVLVVIVMVLLVLFVSIDELARRAYILLDAVQIGMGCALLAATVTLDGHRIQGAIRETFAKSLSSL